MAPKVGRLNQTNCPEYAYLRSHGNMWQYDPDKVHPNVVARLLRRFDTFDLNADDRMTLSEVSVWPERMRKLVNATDEEVEKMKAAIIKVFGDKGISNEGLLREDWIESNRVFMEAEKERAKHGELSHVALLGNAYFDVLDKNGNITVSMDELKTMMNAFEVPEDAAYTFFEKADVNKNGKLERAEMHKVFSQFWLTDYTPEYDGIFAYKY